MKLIVTKFEDHSEVVVRDSSGINLHVFIFDDHASAKAFITGWRCCQSVINGMVQSLPQDYTLDKR